MERERERETWDQYAGIELTLICHLWTEVLNQSVVHVCGDSKAISELFASEDGGFFPHFRSKWTAQSVCTYLGPGGLSSQYAKRSSLL